MGLLTTFMTWYGKHYKALILLPLVIALFSAFIVVQHYVKTGDIFNKDVSLKGGMSATILIAEPIDTVTLESTLQQQFEEITVRVLREFGSNQQQGILIETSSEDEQLLRTTLTTTLHIPLTEDNFSLELMGSSLGDTFYNQMLRAIFFAYLFMAIVVFITFRALLPSFTTVFASAADIIAAMAFVDLMGTPISTAGIAAFLMIIGYSVDNDILLKARVLRKSESTPLESAFSAFGTGLTMSVTAIVTVLLGWILSSVPVFKEMFMILFFGLVVDIIMTYCLSAPVLLWDLERKGRRSP